MGLAFIGFRGRGGPEDHEDLPLVLEHGFRGSGVRVWGVVDLRLYLRFGVYNLRTTTIVLFFDPPREVRLGNLPV